MSERELWATGARPQRLRISLERVWLEGDDVYDLSLASHPTKGDKGEWVVSVRHAGPDSALIVAEVCEQAVAKWTSPTWAHKPRLSPTHGLQPHLEPTLF